MIERGEVIVQETRGFDETTGKTFSQRIKEDSHDYRYFPDPDLLPVIVTAEQIAKIKTTLPELPLARAARFQNQLGLSAYDASVLTQEKDLADYFEQAGKASNNYKLTANWIMTDLVRELNTHHTSILNSPISANHLAELITLIESGQISGKIAKFSIE